VLSPSSPRPSEAHIVSQSFQKLHLADLVLAPLALGGHVDHLLVREAARQAFAAETLLFYEDLPYACWMSAAERAAEDSKNDIRTLEAALLGRAAPSGTKQYYSSCYPSQIAPEVADEMETYAETLGGRERLYGKPEAVRKLQIAFDETV